MRWMVLPLLVLAPWAAGQHHATPWSFSGGFTDPVLGQIDLRGAVTPILHLNQLPKNVFGAGAAVEADNRTYVLALLSKVMNASLLRVDRQTGILATIQLVSTSPQFGGPFAQDVLVDQDGNYVVALGIGGGARSALLKVDPQFRVTTLIQAPTGVDFSALTVDRDTGNYLVTDRRGRTLYEVARDGSSLRARGHAPTGASLRDQVSQDVATGEAVFSAYISTSRVNAVLAMDRTGQVRTLASATTLGVFYGVHPDRASAPRPRLLLATSQGFYFVDRARGAVTTLATTTTTRGVKVFPRREVSTVRRQPGVWDIVLDYGSAQGGYAYAMALSLSGVRPPVPLPDGRRIWLNVDNLTLLSLTGRLAPVLTGNIGVLGPSGRGGATLNVSRLPVGGVTVWIQALTFHPSAPLGIHTISDPILLVL